MTDFRKLDPRDWLIGAWQSDRDRTLKEWLYGPKKREELQQILERDLGKLIRRFTASQSSSQFDDQITRTKYRVLWHNADSIFIVHGPKTNETGEIIRFLSPDTFWVHCGRNIEYFQRAGT